MSAKMKILLKAATLSKGSHNHIQDEPMSFVILSLRRKKKKKESHKDAATPQRHRELDENICDSSDGAGASFSPINLGDLDFRFPNSLMESFYKQCHTLTC